MRWKTWKRRAIALTGCLGISPLLAQTAISTDGTIESKSGGFKFPDGSVQITAVEVEVADPCANPNDPADEMILVGGVCIDKYEASVWSEPDGGIQYAVASDDYPCSDTGQDCFKAIYARSVAGVQPSANLTWFQAQQALANSGKRLPTNAEWQMAVAGTPDTGLDDDGSTTCNSNNLEPGVALSGSRSACVSHHGAFDMVGNLWEWVADWGDDATNCTAWPDVYGDDLSCFGLGEGQVNSRRPGVHIRGGGWFNSLSAGPFAADALEPSDANPATGFRGAR